MTYLLLSISGCEKIVKISFEIEKNFNFCKEVFSVIVFFFHNMQNCLTIQKQNKKGRSR
jgi:hypothetical protein